jgi:hypothetical protein
VLKKEVIKRGSVQKVPEREREREREIERVNKVKKRSVGKKGVRSDLFDMHKCLTFISNCATSLLSFFWCNFC